MKPIKQISEQAANDLRSLVASRVRELYRLSKSVTGNQLAWREFKRLEHLCNELGIDYKQVVAEENDE